VTIGKSDQSRTCAIGKASSRSRWIRTSRKLTERVERAVKAELGIEIDRFKVSLEDLTDPIAILKRPTNRAFRSFLTREKVCRLTGKRMVHSNTANGF
jgi:hypothetical protein